MGGGTLRTAQAPEFVNNVEPMLSQQLGCMKALIHKVQGDSTVQPVKQKLRRLPLSLLREVSAGLDRWLLAGMIECVDASESFSPIVVAQRLLSPPSHGGPGSCHTLQPEWPQCRLPSTTVPLHPERRKLTAFIPHDGLFQFTRVPFGLALPPSVLQKRVQTILKDQPGVLNYLVDIIVNRESKETQDSNLQAVLRCLSDAGLQINSDNSSFSQTSICFLGHTIYREGLRPSPDHLTAIYVGECWV